MVTPYTKIAQNWLQADFEVECDYEAGGGTRPANIAIRIDTHRLEDGTIIAPALMLLVDIDQADMLWEQLGSALAQSRREAPQ